MEEKKIIECPSCFAKYVETRFSRGICPLCGYATGKCVNCQ
jgi:hypothetical protein